MDAKTPIDPIEDWEPTHTFTSPKTGAIPVMRVFKHKDGLYYIAGNAFKGERPSFLDREGKQFFSGKSRIAVPIGGVQTPTVPEEDRLPSHTHPAIIRQAAIERAKQNRKNSVKTAPPVVKEETVGKSVGLSWQVAWMVLHCCYWPSPDSCAGYAETGNGDCARMADQRGPNGEKVVEVFLYNRNDTGEGKRYKVMLPKSVEFPLYGMSVTASIEELMTASVEETYTDCMDEEDARELLGASG